MRTLSGKDAKWPLSRMDKRSLTEQDIGTKFTTPPCVMPDGAVSR